MATIVQPYNPWREQLAANFIGPLLGNMIQRSQEAEQNRKYNAFLSELQNAGNSVQEPLTGQWISTTPDPLAKQDFTLGFGSESRPWANSFFDSGNLPQMNMNMTAAPSPLGADQIRAISDQLLGSKRFSMLDPAKARELVNPYLQEAEKARREGKLADIAGSFTGAADNAARRNVLWDAAIQGLVDPSMVGTFQKQIEADRPQPFSVDLGGSRLFGNRDPNTGAITPNAQFPVTMTPYQAGELALGQDRNALGWAKYNTNPKESPGISETDRWKAAIDMKKSQIEGIRKQREEIRKSLNIIPGEDVPPDIATQISHLNAQEAALMEEYNTLVNGTQGGQGLSQDEGYNALPDEWKQKADEWRKRGYDIQVHWYGENQCQIFAIDPRNRDSTTQINPKQENIKRVKTPAANDGVLFLGDTMGSGDVRPQGQTPATQSVTRAEYDAMCAKYGKEAVDAEMKRNGVPIPG